MKRFIFLLLMVALLFEGFFLGVLATNNSEVEAIVQFPTEVTVEKVVDEPYIVYQEVPIYVEVEVIKEVPIEVTKWRNIYPRRWESVAHFKEWYLAQKFNPLLTSPAYTVDCDDYAERLQRKALEQGYSVSIALIKNGYYYGVKVSDIKAAHAGNLIEINGVYYYVEPTTDKFEVKRVVARDK